MFLVGALAFALDQISKAVAIVLLSAPPQTVKITSFFNLSLGFNPGVSFGFLSDLGEYGPHLLSALTMAIIVFLIVWLCRSTSLLERTGVSLIVGGAAGNLIDRIRIGAVTDFLDFHLGPYHWPTFNFADVWITSGAALIITVAVFASKFDEQTLTSRSSQAK